MNVPDTSSSLVFALGKECHEVRWKEFIDRYRPMMEGFLRTKYFNIDYEDVIQETLIALSRALPNYKYNPNETGAFHDYIVAVLRNKACNALRINARQEKAKKNLLEVVADRGYRMGEEDSFHRAIMKIALKDLLDDQSILMRNKRIFVETAINGHAPEVVAAMFGVERNNVDQIKSRMIKRLQNKCNVLKGVVDG